MPKERITMQHVITAADRIVELQRRCYERARNRGDFAAANNHRTTAMDALEGIKTVLIAAKLHQTMTYHYVSEKWNEVLENWV